jgi:hypothetical protein
MNISTNLVLTVAVLGFMAFRLVTATRYVVSQDGRTLIGEIVRGVRWRHCWPIPLIVAAVLGIAGALMQLPGLSWGWWSAIGGSGNPITGSTTETAGTIWEWLIPLVFLSFLLPALPLFAHAEERMFRQGAQTWSPRRRAWMIVKFGLAHALIGIPIGVALALSVGGAYFMAVYLRSYRATSNQRVATLESTRAHTAYNGAILSLVLVVVVIDALA